MMEPPSPLFIVRLLHSIPHINITLHRVNDTFNLKSDIYLEVSHFNYELNCVVFIDFIDY